MCSYNPNISVVQLGARMHYAVPRILYNAGLLQCLYTDICANKGWPRALHFIPPRLRTASLRRLLARVPADIPLARIESFNNFGWEYTSKLRRADTASKATEVNLWAGNKINELALAHWSCDTKVVYGYNSACEKLFLSLCDSGLFRIMEQTIAPKASEIAILSSEQEIASERDYKSHDNFQDQFIQREKQEWRLSDCIICGSEFVRDEVVSQGGDPKKCFVVPYGVQLPQLPHYSHKTKPRDSLRILFVGSICVRKGVRYLLEAMRKLQSYNVKCRVVGPISMPFDVSHRNLPWNVEIVGPIPRSEVSREFAAADVFCLPSLCEGSATVIYEALAAGLPVVTTPNAGSIVRDGIEGFIVPIQNSDLLAEKLAILADNHQLLSEMTQNAILRSQFGSIDAYADRLLSVVAAVTNLTII